MCPALVAIIAPWHVSAPAPANCPMSVAGPEPGLLSPDCGQFDQDFDPSSLSRSDLGFLKYFLLG